MTLNATRRRDFRRCRLIRVLVDGVDVTRICRYIDGRRRLARLYVIGESGNPCIDARTGKIALMTVRGRIQILRKADDARRFARRVRREQAAIIRSVLLTEAV